MYGLLLRSIQGYVAATFGAAVWLRILRAAGQPQDGFEPLLDYHADVLDQVLLAASAELHRPGETILEDVGTFIIADAGHRSIRRLLRFVGASYADFLLSLEELPDRARLALADLELPALAVEELGGGHYRVTCASGAPALFHVAIGILRAMADDYGTLALLEIERRPSETVAVFSVQVLEAAHGVGRRFDLAAEVPADGW
mgnify:CR=1 FL=1